jgi:hypothetical protein
MKVTKTFLKDIIREVLEEQEGQPQAAAPKQRADVARVSKKMGATSGLADMMQNIDNRLELQELLLQLVQGVGEKLKPQDIYMALNLVAKQIQKGQ